MCFRFPESAYVAWASRPCFFQSHGRDAHVTKLLLALTLLVAPSALAQSTQPTARTVLRVAADPNNLPFSNDKLEGFENKLADLVARDMGVRVEYVWHAQRRGFFRQTLKEGD